MKRWSVLAMLALSTSTVFANDRSDVPEEPETKTVVVTEKGDPFWAGVGVSTAVLGAGLLSAGMYYNVMWRSDIDNIRVSKSTQGNVTEQDCGAAGIEDKNGVFTSLCARRDRAKTLMLVGLALVPVAITTTYLGFFRVTTREVKSVALVPTITTHTAGLSLDVRW